MIDFHTHTFFSDGELLPSELVRRAEAIGYEAIGLTDHCDWSNIDFVVPHIVKVSRILNAHWKIKVIPGVELTHVPLEEIEPLSRYAKEQGAKIVILHGETLSEPVLGGTNKKGIECGVNIIAHPGRISEEDAALARDKGVYLEITSRNGHSATNRHVVNVSRLTGAKLVINTDAHKPIDLITINTARSVLNDAGLNASEIEEVLSNSKKLLASL
ncbi:MAG: histidinol phosphate phosphatase domain-containing protein [Candidatus Omnitrophica bacterium]|nr:histidinol phosphate phosphatase domain-containing protein [Candidatus Omnitrophota bacterium]